MSNCRVRVALHLAVHSNAVSQNAGEFKKNFQNWRQTFFFLRLNEEGPEENGGIGRGFFFFGECSDE